MGKKLNWNFTGTCGQRELAVSWGCTRDIWFGRRCRLLRPTFSTKSAHHVDGATHAAFGSNVRNAMIRNCGEETELELYRNMRAKGIGC
ncbi:MAG: hypothetical protein U1D06_01435, partial [Paracoccaceae bacterium]|nr:hypothetical protein [Paracoccaceae bacterium]